jgi:ABC-2 type transport system permease protein
MTKVVLGKYFAMLVMLLIPTAIMGIYPLVLSAFGNVYLPASFGAIVGFFFLGAALLSIGMFISSITESQAVAAGLCFVVMLLNYYLSSLADYVSSSAFASFAAFTVVVILLVIVIRLMTKSGAAALAVGLVLEAALIIWYVVSGSSFEGLFPEIMEKLSLFERFYTFVNGVFDVTSLVYFVTVIGVFLFLSVQSMEKRRWSE